MLDLQVAVENRLLLNLPITAVLPNRLELGYDAVSGCDILLTGYKGRNVKKLQAGELSRATEDLANALSLMISSTLILCTKRDSN